MTLKNKFSIFPTATFKEEFLNIFHDNQNYLNLL